jgi:GNAT superfamily N-acetyltransferase
MTQKITQQLFDAIQEKLSDYNYTSMKYTDFETVSEYDLIADNEKVVLLFGCNPESNLREFHWAANTAADLLASIGKPEKNIRVSFVPPEWVDVFKQNGFSIYAQFNDYFMQSLDTVGATAEPEFLTEAECEEASAVTMSCKGQSRGFNGEPAEWFKKWIDGSDDPEMCDKAVIIHREDGRIVGLVCTATYAHESEKGAIVWVRVVAVRPEYQRRGIARKLINQTLHYGKLHGAKRAFLAADELNVHAIHLYESIGFTAKKEDAQIDMISQ